MDQMLLFALIFLSILFIIITVNKMAKPSIKIFADIFIILSALSIIYYLRTHNSPIDQIHNAALSYYICSKNQLYKDECNNQYSKLESSKVKADIENVDSKLINKTIKLAT